MLERLTSFRTTPGRLLRLPLRALPRSTPLPILTGPLRGARWVLGAGQFRCWFGTYERRKQALLTGLLKPNGVVFDIGAHAGFYTLLAARRVGPGGHVYAFEPLPVNIRNLLRHIDANHVSNVDVLPIAVSDRSGTAELSPGDDSYSAHLAPGGEITVDSFSLDDLSIAGRITLPDLVKIDAEGAELAVLEGARGLLRRAKPVVLLATHVLAASGRVIVHRAAAETQGKSTHAECIALLRNMGYSIRGIDASDVRDAGELLATPAESDVSEQAFDHEKSPG